MALKTIIASDGDRSTMLMLEAPVQCSGLCWRTLCDPSCHVALGASSALPALNQINKAAVRQGGAFTKIQEYPARTLGKGERLSQATNKAKSSS